MIVLLSYQMDKSQIENFYITKVLTKRSKKTFE